MSNSVGEQHGERKRNGKMGIFLFKKQIGTRGSVYDGKWFLGNFRFRICIATYLLTPSLLLSR